MTATEPVNKPAADRLLTGAVQDEILRRMLAAYERLEAPGRAWRRRRPRNHGE